MKTQNWLDWALLQNTDECLIWPFKRLRNGYGHLGRNGVDLMAHRVMCAMAHGDPEDGALALHSCGRGQDGCCNPKHLRWGTAKENTADIIVAGNFAIGSRANKSKLQDADIVRMREMRADGLTYQEIADAHNVNLTTAFNAVTGKSWKHVA